MEKNLDEEKEKERIMKYLRDRFVPKVAFRSAALEQIYQENRERLEGTGICYLNQKEVESITNGLQPTHFATRHGSFVLNDSVKIAVLAWSMTNQECERKFAKFFMDKAWKKKFGPIRDQGFHLLCWAYVANDLISASLRRRHNKKFVPLSVWHLCAYCKPWLLGKDPDEEHHCYGCSAENGILHTQYNGGYKEEKKDKMFDCKNHFPPRVEHPFIEPGLVKPRLIESLEDALQELQNQPVAADLLYYDGLMLNQLDGVRVYEGPKQSHSLCQAYHSVIMVGVTRIKGELVVICRLTNGSLVGDRGYVYVSLATLYIPVGATLKGRERIRGYSTPRPLLTNFVVAERIVNEGEGEGEDDVDVDDDDDDGDEYSENEDEQDDDWVQEDEKEEDETENPNLKRIRLSKPAGTSSYGSWSCSLATTTSKKLTLKKGDPEEEEDSMESGPTKMVKDKINGKKTVHSFAQKRNVSKDSQSPKSKKKNSLAKITLPSKRKQTAEEEVDSSMKEFVGKSQRVKVWWPLEKESSCGSKKTHQDKKGRSLKRQTVTRERIDEKEEDEDSKSDFPIGGTISV